MNLENHNETNGRESVERSTERRAPEASRITDREVPLNHDEMSPTVHAWLDGEVPESALRASDTARDVDFWKKLNVEVDRRREMRTPPYVYEQIMSSLPERSPATASGWRKAMRVTPMQAMSVGAAVLAAGVAISLIVLRVL